MRTLDLSNPKASESASFKALHAYFKERKENEPRVYRTFWSHSSDPNDKDTFRHFFFLTGSKDIHLALGELPEHKLDALCDLVYEEVKRPDGRVLTLTYNVRGKQTSLIATKISDDGRGLLSTCPLSTTRA